MSPIRRVSLSSSHFFFNDTATTEIYTLSLHDALPISAPREARRAADDAVGRAGEVHRRGGRRAIQAGALPVLALRRRDRKSTRLNSSHSSISYAVFCLKKKTNKTRRSTKISESSVFTL